MTEVRIYRPPKTAMQSGRANTKLWVLEYEPEAPKFIEPIMGWTGSADTKNQVKIRFESKEEAIAFSDKNGWDYYVEEPHERRVRPKSYADNFSARRPISWTH